jgi:hypothetical protein
LPCDVRGRLYHAGQLDSRSGTDAKRRPELDRSPDYLDIRTGTEFLDIGRRGGEPSPGDAYFFQRAHCDGLIKETMWLLAVRSATS